MKALCRLSIFIRLSIAAFLALPSYGASAAEAVQMEPVEVLGTRLPQFGQDLAVPVTTLDRAQIQRSGFTSMNEVLRDLPIAANVVITEAIALNGTRGMTGARLRNLPVGNTLVLVNGRRTTTSGNTWGDSTFVDINRFPVSLVERIEILEGGGAALYGADAVAGVINIVTRQQARGGEMTLSYGNTFDRDAAELRASSIVGATRGALTVSVGFEYLCRNALANRDRDFSRTANLYPRYREAYGAHIGTDYDARSAAAPQAVFSLVPGQRNGTNGVQIAGLPSGAPIAALPGTGGTVGGTLANATPSFTQPFIGSTGGHFLAGAAATYVVPETTRGDPAARNLFDSNEYSWIAPESERLGGSLRYEYSLAADVKLHGEAALQNNLSRMQLAPLAVTSTLAGVAIPATQAYNPFGVDVRISWRPLDLGARVGRIENESRTALQGITGRTRTGWRWDAAFSWSRDETQDRSFNFLELKRLQAALTSSDPRQALNPFGGADYQQDAALLDSMRIHPFTAGRGELRNWDASLSQAELFVRPAAKAGVFAFVEGREDKLSQWSDPLSQRGEVVGYYQTGAPKSYSRRVLAEAGEVRLALGHRGAAGAPVELQAAARHEGYSVGQDSGLRPSVGVVLRPGADLTMRASHADTFRLPTLLQLHAPVNAGFVNELSDPRRPEALTRDPYDGRTSKLVRSGGNPELDPETGRVAHLGLGWAPSRGLLRGFSIEAMWYRYRLTDVIAGLSLDYVMANETTITGPLVEREAGMETYVNQSGGPIVIPVAGGGTQTIAAGQSATVPGRIKAVSTQLFNLSRAEVAGTDATVRYRCGQRSEGAWEVAATLYYADRRSWAYDSQSPLQNSVGYIGASRLATRTTVTYEREAWSGGLTWNSQDATGNVAREGYRMWDYHLVSCFAGYTPKTSGWLKGCSLQVVVQDLLDARMPLYRDAPIGFSAYLFSRPQGRSYTLTLRRSW